MTRRRKETETRHDPGFTAAELRAVLEIAAALRALPAHVAAKVIRRLHREQSGETLPN